MMTNDSLNSFKDNRKYTESYEESRNTTFSSERNTRNHNNHQEQEQ